MTKNRVLNLIIEKLSEDLDLLVNAAKKAHEVSTDQENLPDNKYDTLSLESSYIAQGQANRALEIKRELDCYQNLSLKNFAQDSDIFLTALVVLEADDQSQRTIFLGPQSGGLKVEVQGEEIVVITPNSPLGRKILGKRVGEVVEIEVNGTKKEFEIIELS
ncbi:MAG: GreA/GreB family elongation factor [SAR324 cluster bacterium]|nr:GreA/GreB family elongation factor [SAR324 cluster bacterium]